MFYTVQKFPSFDLHTRHVCQFTIPAVLHHGHFFLFQGMEIAPVVRVHSVLIKKLLNHTAQFLSAIHQHLSDEQANIEPVPLRDMSFDSDPSRLLTSNQDRKSTRLNSSHVAI